jgi:hypothetical protein
MRNLSFSMIYRDLGTFLVTLIFLHELQTRCANFESHKMYLSAILNMRSTTCAFLLGILSVAQFVSCAVIVVPKLYNQFGTAVPSISLGCTLFTEMLIYSGFSHRELTLKACVVWISLFLIGLMRNHHRAKNKSISIILYSSALALEASVRRMCTKFRTGLLLPPIGLFTFIYAFIYHRFWTFSGAGFEIERAVFLSLISQCALMLILSSEDNSPSTDFKNHIFIKRYKKALLDIWNKRQRLYKYI